MAIVTNTFTKYSAVGLREDLSNIIYSISPQTTPFVSNMTKKRNVTNTFFEWQTDSLASAAANAQIDGDDLKLFYGGYCDVSTGQLHPDYAEGFHHCRQPERHA